MEVAIGLDLFSVRGLSVIALSVFGSSCRCKRAVGLTHSWFLRTVRMSSISSRMVVRSRKHGTACVYVHRTFDRISPNGVTRGDNTMALDDLRRSPMMNHLLDSLEKSARISAITAG